MENQVIPHHAIGHRSEREQEIAGGECIQELILNQSRRHHV